MKKNDALIAKARAMYGKRLTPDCYERLMLAESIDGAAKELAQHPAYAAAAALLREGTLHRGYLESVLRRQYYDDFLRLYRYLNKRDRQVVASVFTRYEITELLYCFQESREKAGLFNFRNERIDRYIRLDLNAAARAENHAAVLEAIAGTPYRELLQPLLRGGVIRYVDAETALFGYYYKHAAKIYENLSAAEGRQELTRLEGERIDSTNLARVVRLRTYFNMAPAEIVPYLIAPYYKLDEDVLNRLMRRSAPEEWIEVLRGTPYAQMLDASRHPNMGENLDEMLLRGARKAIHFSESAPAVLLAYLRMKEIEIKNVITVIESKRYGLNKQEIRTHLIGLPDLEKEA